MAKSIIAHPAQESTTRIEPGPVLELIRDRSERGLAFFAEFGGEFVEVAPGIVRVPSGSGGGFYDVDLVNETCPCPDFEHHTSKHGVGCAHVYGVGVAAARRRAVREALPCDGCGRRFRGSELIEVQEHHESLTFFEGDMVCEECAANHGVL